MSGVLEYFDYLAENVCYDGFPQPKLEEARDAVAELIKAAERVGDACSPETAGWDDLQSALRRVKGDA